MYDRILVPFDGSATAQRGLEEAITLAARLGSTLHVMHAVEATLPAGDAVPVHALDEQLEGAKLAGRRMIERVVEQARAAGVQAEGSVRCDPGSGVSDMVLHEARERRASLIVMGTHGRRGMLRLVLGSDAELVLRGSPVPVLLVRHPQPAADDPLRA